MKFNAYNGHYANRYFWRTHAQQEIDYIEESGGKLHAMEIKWSEKARSRFPSAFKHTYSDSSFSSINKSNYLDFIS